MAPSTRSPDRDRPDTDRRSRWERGALGVALVLAFALSAARLFAVDERSFVTHYSNDDTYYYFQIARNLARGEGPSFDGEEWTNGLQPLWCLALVPVFALCDDAALAARWGCALSLALFVAALALLARVLAPTLGRGPAALAAAAAALAAPLRDLASSGMDWSLNLLLAAGVVGAFARLARRPVPRPAPALLGAGLLVGLYCIQRPDTGLLPVLLTLPLLRRRSGWREAALLVAGALVVAGPFLLGSRLAFGGYLPVSGTLKTRNALSKTAERKLDGARETLELAAAGPLVAPALALAGDGATGVGRLPVAARAGVLAALLVLAAWTGLRRRRARTQPGETRAGPTERSVAAPLLLHAALHVAVVAVFLFPYVSYGRWYFAPQAIGGLVLTALVACGVRELGPRIARGAAAVAVVLLAAGVAGTELREWRRPPVPDDGVEAVALEVAAWLADELGPDARIGVFNAGRIAYYADGCVVNLDGLVNTYAFARTVYLEAGAQVSPRIAAYFVEKRLRWLLDVWNADYEGRVPELRFKPHVAGLFRLERTWPVAETYDGQRPASYQLYRFDLDAALELAGAVD